MSLSKSLGAPSVRPPAARLLSFIALYVALPVLASIVVHTLQTNSGSDGAGALGLLLVAVAMAITVRELARRGLRRLRSI